MHHTSTNSFISHAPAAGSVFALRSTHANASHQTGDENSREHDPRDCLKVSAGSGDFTQGQDIPVAEGRQGDKAEIKQGGKLLTTLT